MTKNDGGPTDFQKAKEAALIELVAALYGARFRTLPPETIWLSYKKENLEGGLNAALSAFREAGYVLVPVKPTGSMVLAALATAVEEDGGVGYYPALFYKGMLTAAQKEQEG